MRENIVFIHPCILLLLLLLSLGRTHVYVRLIHVHDKQHAQTVFDSRLIVKRFESLKFPFTVGNINVYRQHFYHTHNLGLFLLFSQLLFSPTIFSILSLRTTFALSRQYSPSESSTCTFVGFCSTHSGTYTHMTQFFFCFFFHIDNGNTQTE